MDFNIPKHIAIIMDGNGRWAQSRGLPRIKGHEAGVQRIEEIINAASDSGVKYVTFYAFSKENWQRPKAEVGFLMDLLAAHLDEKNKKMMERDAVFKVIGHREDLPEKIQQKIAYWEKNSQHRKGITTIFAFSYSSRHEIARACRLIAEKAAAGKIKPEAVTEETVESHLYTAGIPDPDLLIRTSGEMRISNFLLWQISYAELYVTEKYWPEFTSEEFAKAVDAYQKRERRFGGASVPLKER
ncbi:MAG TPA: isoprenyl transferase [bacterium]|nr:isoprenyl transferase [bacterium]